MCMVLRFWPLNVPKISDLNVCIPSILTIDISCFSVSEWEEPYRGKKQRYFVPFIKALLGPSHLLTVSIPAITTQTHKRSLSRPGVAEAVIKQSFI